MPSDLYYFYESDFNKSTLQEFYRSLPTESVKKMFCSSMGGLTVHDLGGTNVLQGYRGPHSNGSSGDSEYLGPTNGLQEVRYKWGVTKHLNWIPVAGNVAFAASRYFGNTDWHGLYFDSETGECLSHDVNEAAEKLNDIGHRLFQEGRYSEATKYYRNAYRSCSSGYRNELTFKNNIDKAIAEHEAENLNSEGDQLFEQGKYSEAEKLYEDAYNKSCVEKDKYGANKKKAQSINKLSALETLWSEAWNAENDSENDRSEGANEMFQKVLSESKNCAELFPDESRFKQYECLCRLKLEGNLLFNQGVELLNNGIELFQEGQKLRRQQKFELAQEKLIKATVKFSDAQKRFETGGKEDHRFLSCVEFVQEQLEEVKNTMEITEKLILKLGLSSLNFNDDRKRHLETNFEELEVVESKTAIFSI